MTEASKSASFPTTHWSRVVEDGTNDCSSSAEWANFGALKQTFGSADQVGNCVIFDVGNNRFRLIGRVFYGAGKLYVLRVMDHHEYDKGRWVDDCGCFEPPPRKPPAVKKSPSPGATTPRRLRRGR